MFFQFVCLCSSVLETYLPQYVSIVWAAISQWVQLLVTGWTIWGSNPFGGARFSTPVQNGPEAHPFSYTVGTGPLFRA
jgi:hypothetical protein